MYLEHVSPIGSCMYLESVVLCNELYVFRECTYTDDNDDNDDRCEIYAAFEGVYLRRS